MQAPTRLSRQDRADFRAAALTAGRYDQLVREYGYPLTVFLEERRTLLRTDVETWAFFQSFHAALRSGGILRLDGRVTAVDLPRNGRFRVWTDWIGHGPAAQDLPVAASICYCHQTDEEDVTEMVHFTRLSLPALRGL